MTASQIIDQIQLKLNKIDLPLPEPLHRSFLLLIQFFLSSSQLHCIRTPLLGLIYSLDQHDFRLSVQLSIQLIENYAQLNRSIVQDIIQHNLDRDPKYIHLFELAILQLVQELELHPDRPQLVQTLCLITQSHPQLLQLFYQPSSTSHHHNTPLVSVLNVIQDNSQTWDANTSRRQLIFIVLNVLKDGIIPRLQQASAAFDSTNLVDQLSIILRSTSAPLLNDLCLNYPTFIDQLDQLIGFSSNTGSYSQNLSIKSKNQLKAVFTNQKDLMIFAIFQQFKSKSQHDQSVTEDKITDVLKSRKNLFDDHQMDAALLRKGKSKLDEREILNDKSHLTDAIKMKMKSRLEAIEMDSDSEESGMPMIYDDNDDEGSDVLGENDEDERKRRLKKSLQVDIFSDDDHLFFSNKGGQIDKSDEEGQGSEPEEEEQPRKMAARQSSHSFTKNKHSHIPNNKSQEASQVDRGDGQRQPCNPGKDRGNQRRNETESRAGGTGLKNLRGQPRRGGERGRGGGDIGSRGGGTRGRGANQGKPQMKHKSNDRKLESSSTRSQDPPKPQPGNNNVGADSETVDASHSRPKTPVHSTRGTGGRGRGGADHQKKAHDRRVRGRDRKLAQVSGGI